MPKKKKVINKGKKGDKLKKKNRKRKGMKYIVHCILNIFCSLNM